MSSLDLLVRSLEFEPPLSLRGLHRGLERGQHGVCLGEHLLVVGLALVGGLQHLLGLALYVAEVTGAGEAGEEAEEDLLTGLLLTLKAAAKILTRSKQIESNNSHENFLNLL